MPSNTGWSPAAAPGTTPATIPAVIGTAYFRGRDIVHSASDFHVVLGVEARATDRDIARAYMSLMRHHHPDTARSPVTQEEQAEERGLLAEIMEAYAVLSDPARRERYDRNGQTSAGSSPGLGLRMPGPASAAGRGLCVEVSPLRWDVPARRWF